MIRLTGFAFFALGVALLFFGWRSYDAVAFALNSTSGTADVAKAPWLLALGLSTSVWGLSLFSRRV